MRRNSLAVLLLCAAAAQSQPPAALSGVVVNSVTGDPIARVHVTLRGNSEKPQSYGAVTTAEGKFSMTPLPAGEYAVEMERAGYLMVRNSGFGENPNAIQLSAGEKKETRLTLVPGGAISGRVVDSTGEPMAAIPVVAEGGWMSPAAAFTDENGHFRLSGLLPGRYRVHAAPMKIPMPPEKRTDGTQEVHYAATYYPGSLTAKGAARITVKPGAETNGIDIRLVRTPIVRVSGRVVGFPNPDDVNISVRSEGPQSSQGPIKPDGSFDIWRLDPGKYQLVARAGVLSSAPVEIEVAGGNIDSVILRAVPRADIPGAVTYEEESAKPPKTGRLVLKELGAEAADYSAEIDADGSFRLEKVPPGRYLVSVSWQLAYVKSVSLGPAHMDGRVLDLTSGPGGASLGIVAGADGATISGTVRDDNGTVPAFAVLVPETESAAGVQMAMGPKGSYSFTAVAPGNYTLFALPPGEGIRPDAIARDLEAYESVMEHISVAPRDKLTKDLRLASPDPQ